MKALQARKQLLVLESELNRAQLIRDLADAAAGVRKLKDGAKSLSSIGSTAASLVSALLAFRRGTVKDASSKPSRLETFLKAAGLISSLWLALRSRTQAPKSG
jgi:hypothetical protein